MEDYLKYIVVAVVILSLDAAWIFANFKMYSQSVRAIQKSDLSVNMLAAIAAYAVIIFASLYISIPFTRHYVSRSDNTSDKLWKAFAYGGAVGFSVHAIYNLTSVAIYKNYEWPVAIADTVWGTILHTVVVFTYLML
jgi:uncharacterized membrane protein